MSIFEAARDMTHRGYSLRAALEWLLARNYEDKGARELLACYRRPT